MRIAGAYIRQKCNSGVYGRRSKLIVSRFLAFFLAMALAAEATPASANPLELSALRNIPIGEAKRFSELSSFRGKAICLLTPYQERLPSEEALAARVNEYLATTNFSSDEGHFSFVLVGDEAIDIVTFKRSQQLDVLSDRRAISAAERLPKGFAPHGCASGENAALMKVRLRERSYVVLGEAR